MGGERWLVRGGRVLMLLGALMAASGCVVTTGPKTRWTESQWLQGVLRLGEVSTRFTGSWAASAPGVSGFDGAMAAALNEGPSAGLFTGDPAGLVLHVDLTVDHADDGPRLMSLGLMSVLTAGVVPLWFTSVWDAQATARVVTGEGREVARYPLHAQGTYKIFALPPTMFTLLGAGIRGDNDYKAVERKICKSLAQKLYTAVRTDHARLAKIQRENVPTLAALGGGAQALLERGRMHLAAGRVEKARADLIAYAEQDPRLYGALDSDQILEFYDTEARRTRTLQAGARARQAEQEGQPAEAFGHYQRAYALAPNEAEAKRYAGELLRLYRALPRDPPLPEVARGWFIQGEERAHAQQYSEAEASFHRVTRVAPWFPQGYFNLALVLARLERYGEAAGHMDTFLKLAPESEHAEVAQDRLWQWKGRTPAATP